MSLLPLAVIVAMQQRLNPRLSRVVRRLAHAGVVLVREHLGFFLALAVFGAVCWFFGGWRLRGWRLLLWDLVLPLLAVALVCVVGPGHLFPKEPYEGPRLITFSPAHSLTCSISPVSPARCSLWRWPADSSWHAGASAGVGSAACVGLYESEHHSPAPLGMLTRW